jgi:hypothetical protein
MKGLLVAVVVCGLVPAQAQRAGGHAGVSGPAATPDTARRGFGDGGRRSFGRGLPFFYGGYDGGTYAYPAAPGVTIVMPAPAEPEKPPEPAQPVVHEYTRQAAPEPAGRAASEFSLVGSDGSVRSAIAVWVQGDVLHYVDPEGGHGQLPLSAVNPASTRRANAEKGLTLRLPAPAAR